MEESKLKEFLSKWEGTGEMPVLFPFKGTSYKPTAIKIMKGGMVKATIDVGSKKGISVPALIKDLSLLPYANSSFELPTQEPKLKVNDYIRVSTSKKKTASPYITDSMRECDKELGKIELIDNQGFYKILIVRDSGTSTPNKYKWSDKWITKLTKKEYEDELIVKPFENLVKSYVANASDATQMLSEKVREEGRKFTQLNRQLMIALEKKNKGGGDLVAQKKAEFMEHLAFIKNDSRVNDVSITGQGVKILTNPVSIRTTTIPLLKKYTPLPAYEININLRDNNVAIHLIKGTEPKGWKGTDTCEHPHLHVGSACLGNTITFLTNAMSAFNIKDTSMVMLEFLENYNHGSPHRKMNDYHPKAPKCKACSKPSPFSRCEECGHVADSKPTKEKYIMPIDYKA